MEEAETFPESYVEMCFFATNVLSRCTMGHTCLQLFSQRSPYCNHLLICYLFHGALVTNRHIEIYILHENDNLTKAFAVNEAKPLTN